MRIVPAQKDKFTESISAVAVVCGCLSATYEHHPAADSFTRLPMNTPTKDQTGLSEATEAKLTKLLDDLWYSNYDGVDLLTPKEIEDDAQRMVHDSRVLRQVAKTKAADLNWRRAMMAAKKKNEERDKRHEAIANSFASVNLSKEALAAINRLRRRWKPIKGKHSIGTMCEWVIYVALARPITINAWLDQAVRYADAEGLNQKEFVKSQIAQAEKMQKAQAWD